MKNLSLFSLLIVPFLYSMERDVETGIASLEISIPHTPVIIRALSFEIAGEDILEEEEQMAQFALATYFQQRSISHHVLIPALRRRIRIASDSPGSSEREAVSLLRRMMSGQSIDQDDRPLRYLQDLVLNATAEALQQVEEEVLKAQEESRKKVSKSNAVLSGSIIGLLGVCATLIVHFTEGNCS